MFSLSKVCKSYNGRQVLDDISLQVDSAEIAGLLGPSGSGKSTILKIVAGLTLPDSGKVFTSSKKIGFVFQEHRLIPWKTALENVSLCLIAAGKEKKEAHYIANTFLEQVELVGFETYYPSQLSGGMCQRVSIARAFATQPDILLLDEPFASLDSDLKQSMLKLIKDMFQKTRLSMLYVTHDPAELTAIAHSVYRFSGNGQLVKNSTQNSVLQYS